MSDRTILITGATGLVGNNVARLLCRRRQKVRLLVRKGFAPRVFQDLDVTIVTGDICDGDSVAAACEGVDCVVHCAGYVQIGRSRLDQHRRVNVEGTRNVARAARRQRARLVHVSSSDTLGACTAEAPADEHSPWADSVAVSYVTSKREAEKAVLEEGERGLDAVVVIPAFMLGPWDWKPSSGRMLLEVARGRGFLAPRGNFSLCDVRDVAEAMLSAMDRGRPGRRYLLAGETITYLDAWRLFAQVTGTRRPWGVAPRGVLRVVGWSGDLWGALTGREPDVNSGAIALAALPKDYSSARAEAELGYRRRPISQTAEDAWRWFQEYGFA